MFKEIFDEISLPWSWRYSIRLFLPRRFLQDLLDLFPLIPQLGSDLLLNIGILERPLSRGFFI